MTSDLQGLKLRPFSGGAPLHVSRISRTSSRFGYTDLLLQRHDQDAPQLQQVLHVILVFLLHAGATVDAVILAALWRDLQAVAHDEGRLTELKPAQTQHQRMKWQQMPAAPHTPPHLLIKAVVGFDEAVELLVGVLDHIGVQLDPVVDSSRSWTRKHVYTWKYSLSYITLKLGAKLTRLNKHANAGGPGRGSRYDPPPHHT